MPTLPRMDVYLASGNEHKFQEFKKMLHNSGAVLNFHSAVSLGGLPEVDESGKTFEASALIKAQALVKKAPEGSWILADDSGLEVDALDGAPGIHSARFSGKASNATSNNLKLLRELERIPMGNRRARFRCVLVFMQAGGKTYSFDGTCEGRILLHPKGDEGFGYDPLFQPDGYDQSFAELSGEEKNRLSHRGQAVQKWTAFLNDLGS